VQHRCSTQDPSLRLNNGFAQDDAARIRIKPLIAERRAKRNIPISENVDLTQSPSAAQLVLCELCVLCGYEFLVPEEGPCCITIPLPSRIVRI
jgi:hypothetical protein